MSGKRKEEEPISLPAEARLDDSPKPYILSEAIGEYAVIYGGAPLDVYQRAVLENLQDERLKAIYQEIEKIISPYNQAIHTTAFLQSRYFQEQEALQVQPKPKPRGIRARLAHLVASAATKKEEPKIVERASKWPTKVGDNYYSHLLKFHEDLTADPRGIILDQYSVDISDIREGSPFGRVYFNYGSGSKLLSVGVSRVLCSTDKFISLMKDDRAKEEVRALTHPRGGLYDQEIESPKNSSAHFIFNTQGIPSLRLSCRGDGTMGTYELQADSNFIYDSGANMFLRSWEDPYYLNKARRHQLSMKGELSAEEYLNLLKGLLVVPLQGVKDLAKQ